MKTDLISMLIRLNVSLVVLVVDAAHATVLVVWDGHFYDAWLAKETDVRSAHLVILLSRF